MIVVDRSLSETEQRIAAEGVVLDLTATPPTVGRGPVEKRLWEWLDLLTERTMNGVTTDEYFRLGRSSYWLHVRARIFHTLLLHAQLFDRLGDPDVLSRVTRVYCSPPDADFWRWWSPGAEVIVGVSPKAVPRVSLPRFVAGELRRLPGYLNSIRLARRSRPEAVLFASSTFNIEVEGQLIDREFRSVLDVCPEQWIRIEYHPLPTVQLEARAPALRIGKRAHRTVESYAALAAYMLARPQAVFRFLSRLRKIRVRFRQGLRHDFTFPDPDQHWSRLLQREIRRVGPSVAMLSLLEEAFEYLLKKLQPRIALVSGENNSPGRTVVDAAKRLGIATVGIQHGDITPNNVDYALNAAEAAGGLPDYFLTWGDRTRDYLIENRHYREDRTIAVGHLRSDSRRIEPDRTMEELRATSRKRILLFTSQPQPFLRNRELSAILLAEFCRRHDLLCVLKLHPRETNWDIYVKAFTEAGIPEGLVEIHGDLYGMIASCDLGSTCYSTTAWEMMAARKPVVIFDPFGMDLLTLRGEAAVFHAENHSDGFENWYAERERHVNHAERLAADLFGPRDGRAVSRVIAALESIAGPICRKRSPEVAESARAT